MKSPNIYKSIRDHFGLELDAFITELGLVWRPIGAQTIGLGHEGKDSWIVIHISEAGVLVRCQSCAHPASDYRLEDPMMLERTKKAIGKIVGDHKSYGHCALNRVLGVTRI